VKPRVGFYGWGFQRLMQAYEKALSEGQVMVRLTPVSEDNVAERLVVMGVDDARVRGLHGIDVVIIDDPYAEEQRTYEGEYHEVSPREAMSQMAKLVKFDESLPAAQSTEKNRGPQPRTKYPRRR
jgi:hypothetical protein